MKKFLNFFLPSLKHSDTTLFDVFEKVFSSIIMRSSVFRDLILAVKVASFFDTLKNFFNFFLLSLNHPNTTLFDVFEKVFSVFSATLNHLNRTVSDLL